MKQQRDLQCLFSYHTLTRRSLFPEVAKRVPSGLKAMWWTGAAVWHFQTHSQVSSWGSSCSFVGVLGSPPPISNFTIIEGRKLLLKKASLLWWAHHLMVLRHLVFLVFHATSRARCLQWEALCLPNSMTTSWCGTKLGDIQFEPIYTPIHERVAVSYVKEVWARKCKLCLHKLRRFFQCRCCNQVLIFWCSCGQRQELFVHVRMYSQGWQYCSQPRKPKKQNLHTLNWAI